MGSLASKLRSKKKMTQRGRKTHTETGGDEVRFEHGAAGRRLSSLPPPASSIETPSSPIQTPSSRIQTPSSMMRLPNELLLQITSYLTSTRDVNALLRTNTRLAVLLPQVLSARLLHTYNSRTRHNLFSETTAHAESLVCRLVSLSIDLDATVCICNLPVSQWCRCEPPLHRAITHSNTAMVAALLHHGANIMARCPTTSINAVHHSIETTALRCVYLGDPRGVDLAILRMLLSGGRLHRMNDTEALSADHQTWLRVAVYKCPRGSVTLVLPFLVRGLDVNVADNSMRTPLHTAVLNNRPDIAALLLQHGADHRTVDSEGTTPWITACNRPNCALIDLLLRRDYELFNTPVNDRGETVEMCLQRELDVMLLADEDSPSGYWDRVHEMSELVGRLKKLGMASR